MEKLDKILLLAAQAEDVLHIEQNSTEWAVKC